MAIEIAGLVKRFGSLRAVDGIDLVVPDGSFQVLYGPNGAGKTTLLKIVAGLSKPTAGTVKLAGEDLVAHPEKLRGRIGFLTHSPYLYGDLSAAEKRNLGRAGAFVASIQRGSPVQRTNMQPGFVITTVNDSRVESASEAIEAIQNAYNNLKLDGYYEGENDLYSYRFKKR